MDIIVFALTALAALATFDVLALRFGVDSRDYQRQI
jgi:hypothetical protein